jgi:hypothetical protein
MALAVKPTRAKLAALRARLEEVRTLATSDDDRARVARCKQFEEVWASYETLFQTAIGTAPN